ncbi:MAG: hypothetical protein IJK80_00380, partial [Firmicutes bacterium]|nr:hypothetical protein [Bacillota bacterium]
MEKDKKVSSFTYDLLERESQTEEQKERREVRRKKLAALPDDDGTAPRDHAGGSGQVPDRDRPRQSGGRSPGR